MIDRWDQKSYRHSQLAENIAAGAISIGIMVGSCSLIGATIGGCSGNSRSPTHEAYERMRAEKYNQTYFKPAGMPRYFKQGAIAGAKVGGGICVLVGGILLAGAAKNRKRKF